MKKNANILIKGTQIEDGEENIIEFRTTGHFEIKKNELFVYYVEPSESGYKDFKTTVRANKDSVILKRSGSFETSMLLERDERNIYHYKTDYGDIMLGVNTKDIMLDYNKNGGRICVDYSLEYNNLKISSNALQIDFCEAL